MTEIVSKISTKVLEQALENTKKDSMPAVENGDSSFKDLLQSTDESFSMKNQLMPNGDIHAIPADNIAFDPALRESSNPEKIKGQTVVDMLSSFNDQQVQMDSLVSEIMYGKKKFNNQELLAIQAHVFHVAQLTEMTVKAVEMTVTSFKGVMNTQIQ